MTDTGLRAALTTRLSSAEGVVMHVYLDTNGYATAGHGHKLLAAERAQYPVGSPITPEQDAAWFDADLEVAIAGARRDAPEFDSLPDVIQEVLVEVAYNNGVGGLAGFTHMLAAAKIGDWATMAAQLMDSDDGRRLPVRYGQLRDMVLSCVGVSDGEKSA